MLGKRQRVLCENSGTLTDKKLKLNDFQDCTFDRESVSTNTQSKCITPVDSQIKVLSEVQIINTLICKNDNETIPLKLNSILKNNKQTAPINSAELKDKIIELLGEFIDEYNCNHQQDLESNVKVEIFTRDLEQKCILDFISDSMKSKKSSLMYLCGHPGTGKTSTLHAVLQQIRLNEKQNPLYEQVEMMFYNAMSFDKVKNFSKKLLNDLCFKLQGLQECKELMPDKRGVLPKLDMEDISNILASKLRTKSGMTKIIVIDEIDCFESYAKDFLTMVKAILASQSNTILIGIANSVDLPFKHKHSAIALRNQQLLFKPYDEQQIIDIMEKKTFSKFRRQSDQLRALPQITQFVFDHIEKRAVELIASKVAKMNGDIRVAFDIIKSCFSELQDSLFEFEDDSKFQASQVKITLGMVAKVFKIKYGSKITETLGKLPRQNLTVLDAIIKLIEKGGDDKKFTYHELFAKLTDMFLRNPVIGKMTFSEMDSILEVLQNYNIIEIDKNGKNFNKIDSKNVRFGLKIEFSELIDAINDLNDTQDQTQKESTGSNIQ